MRYLHYIHIGKNWFYWFSDFYDKKIYRPFKYIIQWLISHTFNVPDCSGLVSYVYDDIKDEAPVVSVTCW